MNGRYLSKEIFQFVKELRREFHKFPETAWNEVRTSEKIKSELEKMGISFKAIAKTGIIATINGRKNGRKIALRADMDGLNIQEENDISFKSKNKGISHACGHDGHVAILLGAAKILSTMKEEICGSIIFIFQPAEEIGEGAKQVIKEGGLESVDSIFCLHLASLMPTGFIASNSGPIMSSVGKFTINVEGMSGHGGMPHQSVDAIVAASSIVLNLQTAVSREISPAESAVISIGVLNAGTQYNVIAGTAKIEGTTRCFSSEVGEKIPDVIQRIATQTAGAFRASAELDYSNTVCPTVNDPHCAKRAKKTFAKLYNENKVINMPPSTGGEDFGYYLQKVPGALVFLGAGGNEGGKQYPHHHPKFNFDEKALEIGTALYVQYALDYLNEF